jgi:hypothetical protein
MSAGEKSSSGAPATAEIPDLLMLAAVERAVRHRTDGASVVPVYEVMEHLGLPPRSRGVRVKLAGLESAGVLQRERLGGSQAWELTATGRRRLQRARRAGQLPELPESPQHRAWRQARAAAEADVDRIRLDLRGTLETASGLLDAPPSHSDDWFEYSECLRRDCRRIGVVIHCLQEWQEPDDARPDIDKRVEPTDKGLDAVELGLRRARRVGRRTITSHPQAHASSG